MTLLQRLRALALALLVPLTCASAVETQLLVTATDDGQPAGSSLTYTWSIKSAPPAATGSGTAQILFTPSTAIPTASAQNPRVVFTVPGTYVFQVAVSDGHLTTAGTTAQDVTITVNPAVDNPPTLTAIVDQRVAKGVSPIAIPITVGDENLAGVVLTYTSSNTALVPNTGTFSGTGGSRTLTLTPAAGLSGTTTITVTATDAGGKRTTRSFALTVNAPPVISSVSAASTTLTLP